MSSSGFAAPDSGGRPVSEPTSSPAPAPVVDSGLLEQVLRETLSASEADAPLGTAEWQAFLSVARQYAGTPLSVEPGVVELVKAVLSARFRALDCPAELWHSAARQIGETLWEDPSSQARLQVLWNRLTEAVT